jgi:hypothetical protein
VIELLKSLGRGIAYTLLSPFYIGYFLLNMLYAILVYLFLEVSSVVMFFLGKSYLGDDYETALLKERKEQRRLQKNQSHFKAQTFNPKAGDDHDV